MMYQVITEIPGGTIYDVAKTLDVALEIVQASLKEYGNAKIEEF